MSLSEQDIQQKFRIACCAKVIEAGPINVKIPSESLAQVQQLLVAGVQPEVELRPLVAKYFIKLPKPSLLDPRPDLERLVGALRSKFHLSELKIEYLALTRLPDVLRDAAWEVTATISQNYIITWVEAGQTDRYLYGFAIDVGTTKLAGYLVDLKSGSVLAKASMPNPQAAFGSDVISRISYSSKGTDELAELQRIVIGASNNLIRECCASANLEPRGVSHIVVVGNTAMHHLFLGISPKYVALSPYTPVLRAPFQTRADQIGILGNPGCLLNALPCVAGFVGADAVADVLAVQVHKSKSIELLIDIGTNTEIVLGDERRLICCSAPSGPAFEGAQITHGMRAEVGAIERVWIDQKTLEAEYSTIGGERARGICGSGVVDAIAGMRRAGIINVRGRISPEANSKRVRKTNGFMEYVLAWKEETQTGREIVLTQQDIEEVKLAKGAIYAGISILTRRLSIDSEDITRLFLAGAFGTYVDPFSARAIGMYPDIALGRISFVGNTAGAGARMALLSKDRWAEAQRIAETMEYVELAADKDFQKTFTDSLYIPHRNSENQ
jgi:uncharacterized 2Fe-2S/4Fe-4S cluster protein (DUF4445 family)